MHSHELTLGLAFGLGALHALEPGHGKTAMLLYLAGERRSFLHPLVMGLSSALSHSISLIGIAAMVHLAHHMVTGDHHHADEGVTEVMRWVSAGLVLLVGLWMTWSAWKSKPAKCSCSHHKHDCGKQDDSSNWSKKTSYSMSAMLGAAFGLMPCPSAMAAYFSGLSSGSPVSAYVVIGLFAAGIAASLTCVGMLVQVFGNRITAKKNTWLAQLPWNYIRAGLITVIGVIYLGHVAFSQSH